MTEPEQIQTNPVTFQVQKHFGPFMGQVMCPDDILLAFKNMSNKILEDKTSKSHGGSLAGKIETELRVYRRDVIEFGIDRFLEGCVRSYVMECAKQHNYLHEGVTIQTSVNSAWIVSQYAGEYNPLHSHTGCEVSGVLYLNVPNVRGRRKYVHDNKNKADSDGNIIFPYSSASQRQNDVLEGGVLEFEPKEGLMIIFPSYLLHTVYPFLGEGERRCMAFNANYRGVTTKDNSYLFGNFEGYKNNVFYGEEKPNE